MKFQTESDDTGIFGTTVRTSVDLGETSMGMGMGMGMGMHGEEASYAGSTGSVASAASMSMSCFIT